MPTFPRHVLVACSLIASSLAGPALAAKTVCMVDEHDGDFETVRWDTETRSLVIEDRFDNRLEGTLVYSQPHTVTDPEGIKHHFRIDVDEPYYGKDRLELITFPLGDKHRIVGANFIHREGDYVLHSIRSSSQMRCTDLGED
jgi:hypothetical protein